MKRKAIGLLIAAAMAAGSAAGITAHAASDPAHEHGHAEAAQVLKLNDGRKWASDEPLRQGMAKIRDAVDARLPAIHRGAQAGQYDALGSEIEAQIAGIVQNCKLDPAADEVLHAILAEMVEGNEALQGKKAGIPRMDGVVQVVNVLESYGEHFEHPGFKAPALH